MHPVLSHAIEPLAREITALSQEKAQIKPLPGQDRWCAQQVMEHLILTYEQTSQVLSKQLRTGKIPRNRRGLVEFILRVQTLGFGYMPGGIPATRTTRPAKYTPEAGAAIAARFIAAAEEMDKLLVESRRKFGIQACGVHPFFGVMRVDEWRRYHAVHASHHAAQLRDAIRYASSPATVEVPSGRAAMPVRA